MERKEGERKEGFLNSLNTRLTSKRQTRPGWNIVLSYVMRGEDRREVPCCLRKLPLQKAGGKRFREGKIRVNCYLSSSRAHTETMRWQGVRHPISGGSTVG